jgi:ABC-type branched-subunit amino acid transport system substrate-binding protein
MIKQYLILSLIVMLLSNCAMPVDTNVSLRNPPKALTQIAPRSSPSLPSDNVVVMPEGGPSSASSFSGEGFHVALLIPQSGKHQALGQSLAESAALSLARLPNAKRLHVTVIDSATLSQGTAPALKDRLMKERVNFVIGPVFAEQAQILKAALATTPGAPPLVTFSNTMTIAAPPLFVAGFDPFAEVLAATKALAAAGSCHFLILPATKAGYALEETLKSALSAKGARILGTFSYQEASFKDLNPTLTKAAASTAGCVTGPSGNAFTTVVALSGSQLKTVLPIIEGQATDIITPALANATTKPLFFADVDRSVWDQVQQYYQGALGRAPSRLDVIAYDMISLAGYLAQEGGETQSALKNPSGFQGLVGLFRFQTQGTIERALAIYRKDQGNLELITPAPQRFAP